MKESEIMNEDLNRVIKGYKPKSNKYYYWILHDLVIKWVKK